MTNHEPDYFGTNFFWSPIRNGGRVRLVLEEQTGEGTPVFDIASFPTSLGVAATLGVTLAAHKSWFQLAAKKQCEMGLEVALEFSSEKFLDLSSEAYQIIGRSGQELIMRYCRCLKDTPERPKSPFVGYLSLFEIAVGQGRFQLVDINGRAIGECNDPTTAIGIVDFARLLHRHLIKQETLLRDLIKQPWALALSADLHVLHSDPAIVRGVWERLRKLRAKVKVLSLGDLPGDLAGEPPEPVLQIVPTEPKT
jgi:hypothetical protein